MDGASSYHRFLKGDNSALGELVTQYNKSLVFFLAGILKNLHSAEDAAADAFVEILVKRPRLKDEGAFRAYLFRAGRNKAVDLLRRQRRFSIGALEEAEGCDEGPDLEALMLKDERSERLHKAIKALPSDYRDVLHLLYFEEMSYADASGAMKKSVKQVTNLAYRAKAALRTALEKEGFTYEI